MDRVGSYRLRKRLAVGGMGEVYLGEKVGPEGFVKPVVLKCVLPQLAKDRAFVNLFLDEARLAALLNHPNIAQVYDFGLEDGVYYIAMEYVPGYTVDEIRRKLTSIGQFMPLQHLACIASQVCQGLHHAHTLTDASGESLGLVHRDVSPHNLIVSVDGSVKIVDFGIAKARAGLTRVQAKGAVGKFGYMSPEQALGDPVDGRSDVFSLGICLWELATNRRLHDAGIDEPPRYTASQPVEGVEAHRAEVPRQLTSILETALSVDRDARFASAREMHLALERFQAAMTHYAGQAALAQFISDLVEGRVGQPRPISGLVEPLGGSSPSVGPDHLEGARAFEEVFGVSPPSDRPASGVHSVPASWEVRARTPSPVAQRRIEGQQRLVELGGGAGTVETPDLLEVTSRRTPPARAAPSAVGRAVAAPRRPRSVLRPLLLLVVLAGLGSYYAYAHGPELSALWPRSEPVAAPAARYQVVSEPPGATVYVDGVEAPEPTPVVVALNPGEGYRVRVERAGRATKVAEVRAAPGRELKPLRFQLEPAGRLIVHSDPPGAQVSVDGRAIQGEVTPLTVEDAPALRTIEVVVELPGRPPVTRRVQLKPGRPRRVSVRFPGA